MLWFETYRHRSHASGPSPAIIMCIHYRPLLGRLGFRLRLLGESEKGSWEKIKWCEAQHLPPTPTHSFPALILIIEAIELLVQNDLIWSPSLVPRPAHREPGYKANGHHAPWLSMSIACTQNVLLQAMATEELDLCHKIMSYKECTPSRKVSQQFHEI